MKITKATRKLYGGFTALELETEFGRVTLTPQKPWILTQAAIVEIEAGSKFPLESVAWPRRIRDGDGGMQSDECTQDTVIVEMARRWSAGDYEAIEFDGEIPIPTFEEADAARWRWDGEALLRF